ARPFLPHQAALPKQPVDALGVGSGPEGEQAAQAQIGLAGRDVAAGVAAPQPPKLVAVRRRPGTAEDLVVGETVRCAVGRGAAGNDLVGGSVLSPDLGIKRVEGLLPLV